MKLFKKNINNHLHKLDISRIKLINKQFLKKLNKIKSFKIQQQLNTLFYHQTITIKINNNQLANIKINIFKIINQIIKIYHFKIHQIFLHKNLKMNKHQMDNNKLLQLKLFQNPKIQ